MRGDADAKNADVNVLPTKSELDRVTRTCIGSRRLRRRI
jgi:hypothetical protein